MAQGGSAVIYCRISSDPGHDLLGVRRQEADCRALCEQLGLNVVDVLVDDDRSAYSGKRRPGYDRLRQMLSDRQASVLVAWHPDRITRHPRELEDLIDLLESSRATVRTVQAGEYDLATPSGRMTARVVGAVARHESEHKSARLRRKHLELAEGGKISGGGDRPFGYEDDRRTVNRREARILREAARAVLGGESLRSIVADLTRRGVTTTAGNEWRSTSLRRLLMSARIAGLRSHRGADIANAEWPAIITIEQHRRLVAILGDPDRFTNRTPRSYLLTGLARCALCGAKLVARPRSDKRRSYVCASGPNFGGCGKIRVLADPLEELVAATVIARLDTPALVEMITSTDVADIGTVEALEAVEARLAELGEMWAGGEIDRAGWTAARRRLEAERDKLTAEMRAVVGAAALASYSGEAGALNAAWPSMPFDQRRTIVDAVVEVVTVNPAVRGRNYFDPDRVSITWKA